jgi:regulator of protease activity HflC (stomatin/prohibitin superfamily)
MDLVPFYRRSAFKTALGSVLWIGAYLWVRHRAGPLPLPPPAILILAGALALVALLIFLGQLIPAGRASWTFPGEALRVLTALLWAALHFSVLNPSGRFASLQPGLLHLDLAILTLFLTIALVAQFVLPVRTMQERAIVVGRLLRSLVGLGGPVTFVHNGKAIESQRERDRRGAGVLLVDAVSAAVLRTDVEFTRAVGPGLTFTAPGERLAEALDLRPQVRRLPASRPTTAEAAEQERGTSLAITRDGIPVSADLAVTFILHPAGGPEPTLGRDPKGSPFVFYPIAAGKAVFGHVYGAQEDVPWTRLPLLLVVDLWREQVKMWDLPSLLRADGEEGLPLARIGQAILSRLTRPNLESTEPDGRGVRQPSREYRILNDRGIRVLDVSISGLVVPDDVRAEKLHRWHETWSGSVRDAVRDAERLAMEKRRSGEKMAQQALLEDLTAGLRSRLAQRESPARRDTLAIVLSDALRLTDRREMIPEGTSLAAHLGRVRAEILSLDRNCAPPAPGPQP